MERLLKWLEWPTNVLLWVGLIAGTLMMVHVTLDVAGRTLIGQPIFGTTEIVSGYYMVAVSFLPWLWVARTDSHIQVDLFTQMLPPPAARGFDWTVKLVTAVYIGFFTWQSWLRAVQQTNANEVWEAAGFYITIWPTRWMLPLVGGIMAFYLVLRVVADVANALRR